VQSEVRVPAEGGRSSHQQEGGCEGSRAVHTSILALGRRARLTQSGWQSAVQSAVQSDPHARAFHHARRA